MQTTTPPPNYPVAIAPRLDRRRSSPRRSGAGLLLDLAGGDPMATTGKQVTEAATQGDEVAREAFATIGYWLGVAMADLAQIFDPQMPVVGGGVIGSIGPGTDRLRCFT